MYIFIYIYIHMNMYIHTPPPLHLLGRVPTMTRHSHSRVSQQKTMTWRSGVPVDRIEEGESDRLMHLEEILSKRIVGWESQKGGNAIWENDSDQPPGWSSKMVV